MKKIMFNDKYGLTEAVLQGRKIMTRRVISNQQAIYSLDEQEYIGNMCVDYYFCDRYSPYKVGEVVAIAQSYKDIFHNADFEMVGDEFMTETAGWNNKMFVKADLMPHRIRITDLKVERLQDISDEDCLKEGVYYDADVDGYKFFNLSLPNKKWGHKFRQTYFKTPRKAFAALIDKVSGRGMWERNPWVFAYTYELVK